MDYFKIYDEIFKDYKNYDTHNGYVDRYDFIIKEIKKCKYKKIIDVSSGRGILVDFLQKEFPDMQILSTDIKKFNDIDVNFIKLDLTNKTDYYKIEYKYDFLLCLDVLEHIEEKYIEDIFDFFESISDNFCFTIANHSDIQNGTELHLIQKDKKWWDKKLKKHFKTTKSFNKYNNKLYCYILKKKWFKI